MQRKTPFDATHFPPHVLREAAEKLFSRTDLTKELRHLLSLRIGKDSWTYNTVEEFFADYRKHTGYVWFLLSDDKLKRELHVSVHGRDTEVSVEAREPGDINATFEVFERAAESSKLPPLPVATIPKPPPTPPSPPTIFIGHGRSSLWRDLKDHLHEKHGYHVQAYEVGARAGHTIRDILEEMLGKSSFACLLLTAEDEMADGSKRARQNVIHETGLFQGRLGFSRAIVLLEDGAEEFSNIEGIQQIRFGQGNIKETFGEVLATLRREFGPEANRGKSR